MSTLGLYKGPLCHRTRVSLLPVSLVNLTTYLPVLEAEGTERSRSAYSGWSKRAMIELFQWRQKTINLISVTGSSF